MKINDFANLKIELSALPFTHDALEPYMSRETLEYHYEKHHRAYVNKTLSLVNEDVFLLDTIRQSKSTNNQILYNNSAQILNHHIFWLCLQKGVHQNEKSFIEEHFGSYINFKNPFVAYGLDRFGSGWVWLLRNNQNQLIIETSSNGDIPEEVLEDKWEIITLCDIWEHAYYIDYRNERKKFLEVFVDNLMKLHV